MLVMHFRSSSHFGHDNEARNGQAGLYKANNKGKIALTAAVRSSAVIIEPISSADCLILSPSLKYSQIEAQSLIKQRGKHQP